MREIKCRAWDETHKDWVDYGFCLRFDANGKCEILNAFAQPFTDRVLIPVWWTGLHDRLGKDIYEGDMLKVDWHDVRYPVHMIGPVQWDEEIAGWDVDERGNARADAQYFEVIGNIYENPEFIGASLC